MAHAGLSHFLNSGSPNTVHAWPQAALQKGWLFFHRAHSRPPMSHSMSLRPLVQCSVAATADRSEAPTDVQLASPVPVWTLQYDPDCVGFLCFSSPFYGEDFYCEIPRSFRHLSFYVFDRDVFRRDSIIGRCLGGCPFPLLCPCCTGSPLVESQRLVWRLPGGGAGWPEGRAWPGLPHRPVLVTTSALVFLGELSRAVGLQVCPSLARASIHP